MDRPCRGSLPGGAAVLVPGRGVRLLDGSPAIFRPAIALGAAVSVAVRFAQGGSARMAGRLPGGAASDGSCGAAARLRLGGLQV